MSSNPQSVLIVGAGPAGLVAALTLVQNGVPVRIIDKEPDHFVGQRGAGIQPRSLELYHILGVLPEIVMAAMIPPPMRSYELPEGTKPIETWNLWERHEPTPAYPYPNGLLLGQDHLMRILRRKLREYGTNVQLGTRLHSFKEEGDHVVAQLLKTSLDGSEIQETVTVDWIIGTDGAKGVVRKQLGLRLLGETREDDRLVLGEIRLTGIDRDYWHIWQDEKTTVFLRPTAPELGDNTMFSFVLRGDDVNYEKCAADPNALFECLVRKTGRTELVLKEVVNSAFWRPNIRMVDRFSQGRAFVAGDAAHVHSPTGGQGLNSSIQDAINLGWKLALVCKGLASASLLDTYSEERVPVIAQMLNKSTEALKKTMAPVAGKDLSAWQRSRELAQLGVNYRWSSIVLDDQAAAHTHHADTEKHDAYGQGAATGMHAGDSAREAPGLFDLATRETETLFSLFRTSLHTAMIFASDAAEAKSFIDTLASYPPGILQSVLLLPQGSKRVNADSLGIAADRSLVDTKDYARSHYGIERHTTIVLVRPDGVVGGIVHSTEGIQMYFGKVLAHNV
ncbi:hypothetical protein PLICRDRAFT_174374 [Plicaturopsis crispa FD-325 SS-3]|nr:hypothetical protein PLICRDRAFT_174374 [Plicaturopsis crispa FD-325 SS-3]